MATTATEKNKEAEAAIVAQAKAAFDEYAGMDSPDLPADPMSALQVQLARWQVRNFGVPSKLEQLAGITEEAGELAHGVLKEVQKIRGFDDAEFARVHAGDAIGDLFVFTMQLCTAYRLDFGVLVRGIAGLVMKRQWHPGAAVKATTFDPPLIDDLAKAIERRDSVVDVARMLGEVLKTAEKLVDREPSGYVPTSKGVEVIMDAKDANIDRLRKQNAELNDHIDGMVEKLSIERAEVDRLGDKLSIEKGYSEGLEAVIASRMIGDGDSIEFVNALASATREAARADKAEARANAMEKRLAERSRQVDDLAAKLACAEGGIPHQSAPAALGVNVLLHSPVGPVTLHQRQREEILREVTENREAKKRATPSEAIYGFLGWLTSRASSVTLGSRHDVAGIPELVGEFCRANGWPEPRAGWPGIIRLLHPERSPAADRYELLKEVYADAVAQAANGKGAERHDPNGERYEDQQIVQLNEWIGSSHGDIFQACKKAIESCRLPPDRMRAERLGALNYLAAAIIIEDRAAARGEADVAHGGDSEVKRHVSEVSKPSPDPMVVRVPMPRTWCPQCGPGVRIDDEGCCCGCGATANGEGAEAALRLHEFYSHHHGEQ